MGQLFLEIGILNQLISAEMLQVLQPDLSISEFALLNHCVRNDEVTTLSRLAKIFQVSKPSMTATVSKLLTKNYVEILANPKDQRQKLVKVTKEGEEIRLHALKATKPITERLVLKFRDTDFENTLSQLGEVRRYLDESRNRRDGL